MKTVGALLLGAVIGVIASNLYGANTPQQIVRVNDRQVLMLTRSGVSDCVFNESNGWLCIPVKP
jgi:hypothetical protein